MAGSFENVTYNSQSTTLLNLFLKEFMFYEIVFILPVVLSQNKDQNLSQKMVKNWLCLWGAPQSQT